MLPLYMNGRLIQSAAQLRAHFSPEVMFRSRRAFAAVARQSLMPLSDEMRCAGLIFTLATLYLKAKKQTETLLSLSISNRGWILQRKEEWVLTLTPHSSLTKW